MTVGRSVGRSPIFLSKMSVQNFSVANFSALGIDRDPQTGTCLRTLIGNYLIMALKFNGVVVVAGYETGTIKVWEVDTGVCRHSLDVLRRTEYGMRRTEYDMMELYGDTLVCRGADRKAPQIWNLNTGACLEGASNKHKRNINGIGVNDRLAVTSSGDGVVKLWDIRTGEFIRNLFVLESDGCMEKMMMKDAKIVCFVFAHNKSKIIVLNFDTEDSE